MIPPALAPVIAAQHAQTVLTGANAARYKRLLAKMSVPTAKGTVTITGGPSTDTRWSQPGQPMTIDLGPDTGQQEFEHEMGHAFDTTSMTPQARRRFQALMKLHAPGWWGDQTSASYGTQPATVTGNSAPGEQFAEVYRILAQHRDRLAKQGSWDAYRRAASYTYLKGVPSFFQMRKIAALIDQVGGV